MNKLDALKQYKMDGLLPNIEIWISKEVWMQPTPNTRIFNNDKGYIMITDVFFHSSCEPIDRIFLSRYVMHINEIKTIEL